jgi:hypothetical protein
MGAALPGPLERILMEKSFSASVRLRRVVTEATHVLVPLTTELMQPDACGSGTGSINVEKLMLAPVEQGQLRETE